MARAAAKSARTLSNRAKAAAKPVTRSKPSAKTAKAAERPARRKQPARPIELHSWPTPNGWKVAVMLEETGLPYSLKPVNIGRGEQFDPDFLRLSPNGRIPAILDPDGPGHRPVSVFESGAILQYLGRKSGKLYPADERQRIEIDQWLFWQVGGLGPMAGQAQHFRQFAPDKIPYAIERYTAEVARLYGVMNRRLADRDYLAGRYSIADIASFCWIVTHAQQGQSLEDFPALRAWYQRIAARPAVQRGLAVGADLRQQGELRLNERGRLLAATPRPRT